MRNCDSCHTSISNICFHWLFSCDFLFACFFVDVVAVVAAASVVFAYITGRMCVLFVGGANRVFLSFVVVVDVAVVVFSFVCKFST